MKNKLKKLPLQYQMFFDAASKLARSMRIRIYLVGGVVRDLILGKMNFDLDIVVEGDAIAFANKLAGIVNGKFSKHHVFGTATVYFGAHKIDFATARRESYLHWGALPRVEPAILKEDLFRRDFTINALALSLNKSDYGEFVDFYDGLSDLRMGQIRVMHEKSFLEDPTRILRAIRFEQRFNFKIEKRTMELMRESIKAGALTWVNLHRVRDELVLILKEPEPYRYIKRLNGLTGFGFLGVKTKLSAKDFSLFRRIEKTLCLYAKRFKKHRTLDGWLLYLAGILVNIKVKNMPDFFQRLGLNKGERIRILSIKDNILKIRKLDNKYKPHVIYRILHPLSFEAMQFFYAYYPRSLLRKNIEYFMENIVHIRLRIKGRDLKKLNIEPDRIYNKIMEGVLYAKIDRGLKTKSEELNEAKRIYYSFRKKQ